jgi:hypothetical protein
MNMFSMFIITRVRDIGAIEPDRLKLKKSGFRLNVLNWKIKGATHCRAKPNLKLSLIFRWLGLMAPPPHDPYLDGEQSRMAPHSMATTVDGKDPTGLIRASVSSNHVSPRSKSLGPGRDKVLWQQPRRGYDRSMMRIYILDRGSAILSVYTGASTDGSRRDPDKDVLQKI